MNPSDPHSNARQERCFCGGLGPEATRVMESFGPSDSVRQHFRNARIEFLKGLRQLIDNRITDLSDSGSKRGTTVNID
jgi:hypothetical protein